jgi:pyruvate/2-oxoglutarate dehydrogenase complex dihydrolipoamide dehydrogenase (E3) component
MWDLEAAPGSVVAIGGGPMSVELSQAFTRLGIETHTLQRGPGILPRDEPELVKDVGIQTNRRGVTIDERSPTSWRWPCTRE